MLAGKELEDGRRLGELGRPLDVVRQVGKVQAEGELLLCPLLREVVPLLVKVNAIVDQEESDRLTQLKSMPVSIFFLLVESMNSTLQHHSSLLHYFPFLPL